MNKETLGQLVDVFIQTIGRPVVAELEKESGQPIAATVSVVEGGHVVHTANIPEGDLSGTRATGEVRLRLQERTASISIEGQAILRGLAESTGYSGFLLHGKITRNDDSLSAKLTGRTNTYNVWDWQPAFRCATDESTKQ